MSSTGRRRVVITGMGAITPIGSDWETARAALLGRASGIRRHEDWDSIEGLLTRLGAPAVLDEEAGMRIETLAPSIGRVSALAVLATERALADAGLRDKPEIIRRAGVAIGSTSGSPPALQTLATQVSIAASIESLSPAVFRRAMPHAAAAHVAATFGCQGRMLPTCSACTSGSQGIGFAFEAVRYGAQEVMLAGGAEELHILAATVFDIMYATSTRNENPESTPRPFDTARDGLVVGEGAATAVIESEDHALARGATIIAEIVGWGTNCDGAHIVSPSAEKMRDVMQLALDNAELSAPEIGFVNAHGTATEVGDIAESEATAAVFGGSTPVTAPKSYLGHTLGASGAIESWLTISMLREGWIAPTLNLCDPDPRCAPLDHVLEVRATDAAYAINNNFAFGGVNTSLVLGRYRS